MRTALEKKFTECAGAREKLLSTGDAYIVYANPTDRVAGSGLEFSEGANLDPEQWQGWNLLGNILVEVREKMKAIQKKPDLEDKQSKPTNENMGEPANK